jgi:hypothetical protein
MGGASIDFGFAWGPRLELHSLMPLCCSLLAERIK